MALTPQDQLEVISRIASYANSIDTGDLDRLVDNFTPDATIVHSQGSSHSGREEIREWGKNLIARLGVDPASLRHFVGLPFIDGDGDQCRAQTLCVILDYDAEKKIRVPLVGRYSDEFVKRDGHWRIARRIVQGDLRAV